MIIHLPAAVIVAEPVQMAMLGLALFEFVALCVLGLAWMRTGRTMIRRLRALEETTRRWAAGDFSVRSHLAREGGEFGQLALAFNQMMESLERQLLERKQAERRERQRVIELDRAYHGLRQARTQLMQAEKLAAIGRLASGIAHEVKNPLGVILQGIEFLERTLNPLPGDATDTLKLMEDAVNRANTIVQGLLTLARPTPLQLKPGNLHDTIAASLIFLEKLLMLKRITVVKELMDHPPAVLLDVNQMQQVFINLFTNAEHAMPEGGQLTIRTSVRKLSGFQEWVGRRATDRFKLGEEVLVCEVRDTGIGIPQDKLDQVFDPFFTTKPPGEGTGLGLAIVHGIIENHRGFITVDSVEGQGTTMTITLPLIKSPGD